MDEQTTDNEYQNDVSHEMAQLRVLAAEIDGAQALPASPEEQAEQEELHRKQEINSTALGLADEQYQQALTVGIDALWTMAFPNWKLHEAELAPISQLTKLTIDKYFPDLLDNAGPEMALGMVVVGAIGGRMAAGIPARGELPKQVNEGANNGEN